MVKEKDLKTGDILHCKGKGWLSRLILRFTKGKVSHSAIVVRIFNQVYIIGSQSNGTNPKLFKEWLKKYNYEYIVSRPIYYGFNEKEIAVRIFSKVGITKYDYASLFIYQPIYLITGKWIGKKKPRKASKRFYCSEFVSWVYNITKWWSMSPQDLYEIISKDKNFVDVK